MRAIVGLGNPGTEYEGTRHNAGFQLADHLAARWQLLPFRRALQARECRGRLGEQDVRILKPQTYMNRSGAALAPLRSLTDFDPSRDLLILIDDVALPVGKFRLRGAGSAGGHNGLKSIEGTLHRQDYARLRIGVGPRPMDYDDLADFVLDRFLREEMEQIAALHEPMAEAVEAWVELGIEKAMSLHNK
ncbi:MAG TPA: aminoacyl-tRNA hydrolase [Gemmatimonadales bacterium]|jgi:PTH1 family peptidyl-tRNA hydrolase|nr:aminoacyl-tRNA hydrolase [Gemmatimonadales bacterium]